MKKLKSLVCTVALFVTFHTTNGQNIEQEITSFVDSTEILVNNGRRMMLQYVQTQNFERVAEIHSFLTERVRVYNCAPFVYQEELDIALLTNNWALFLTKAAGVADAGNINLCVPIQDWLLFRALRTEIENNAVNLLEKVWAADLSLEEKQLIDLYLHLAIHGNDEAYRQKQRTFRREHPESKYSDFVRQYLPVGAVRGGMSWGMGATQVFPIGGLGNYFDATTVFNISLGFTLHRVHIGLQFDVGTMRLNSPLPSSITGYHHDFQQGDRFEFMSVSFPVGYTVFKTNRFELMPFIGIGGTSIMSELYRRESNRSRHEFSIVDSFTISPGLRSEFVLARFSSVDDIPHSLHLRLDAGYNIHTRTNFTPARGNTFYVRASVVWWLGDM